MKVVLTHEQADFDALAAQLAAALLFEGAFPVLPHKLNRNVRSYLNLYGSGLPFVDPDDLPREEIDSIILVDTQSLVTLRGMKASAKVVVIDHHSSRQDLPAGWEVRTGKVGATTTLLVEELMLRDEAISLIAATFLLLGIYEDTGSFQYASTTTRDIQAGAYLLEHGANLKMAVDFLNPPLSPSQRELYDHLLVSAQAKEIQGFNVIITSDSAPDLEDEISSVAHKLRDLLEPDALFLIVATHEGVRIVARSSRDQINVAAIMAHFNGGGHERAAAALIPYPSGKFAGSKDGEMNAILMKLTEILQENIPPAATVSQVMSRRPMTLKPDTPLEEAATLMQRYGYEGFPVADEIGIVGLLTRRNVDRAVAHKLHVKTSEIMETGSFFVQPTDSLNTLQKVMAESGWGQIPVYDTDKNKIVGIVTRTDLLRSLNANTDASMIKKNLAGKLDAYLPAATGALLKLIAGKASDLGYPVFLVGGIVRDLLLNHPGADLDIVVEGDAIRVAKALVEAHGGRQVSHGRFGTAKWYIRDIQSKLLELPFFPTTAGGKDLPDRVDLISSRTEYYEYPSALPTVERGSIKLDLFRRDFTINTLAIRLDGAHYGELHDYWGGWDDLQQGLIRVLHPLSFIDDPTRLLRAVRFEQRFGFRIEARTLELMSSAVPLLGQISGQRARHELDLYFEEPRFAEMLTRSTSLELLAAIHPALSLGAAQIQKITTAMNEEPSSEWGFSPHMFSLPRETALAYLAWLGQLEEHVAISAANRLRLPADFAACLRQVFRGRKMVEKISGQSPSQIVAHLEKLPLATLFAFYLDSNDEDQKDLILNYVTAWRKVKPFTDGNALRDLGIPPGPVYKKILSSLRAGWLDGEISTVEEEQDHLAHLIQHFLPGFSPKKRK